MTIRHGGWWCMHERIDEQCTHAPFPTAVALAQHKLGAHGKVMPTMPKVITGSDGSGYHGCFAPVNNLGSRKHKPAAVVDKVLCSNCGKAVGEAYMAKHRQGAECKQRNQRNHE